MRVLVISGAFPPMRIGEATNTFYLCQQLAGRGLDVYVLTTERNGGPTGLPFNVYGVMRDWSWSELPRFTKVLRRCSPDAVLLMYIDFIYNDHPMITFAPTVSRRLLPRAPFITRFENPTIGSRQASLLTRCIRKCVMRWAGTKNVDYRFGTLLRDSQRIIVLCNGHRESLSNRYPGADGKSVLIPPPPNIRMEPENNGMARELGRSMLGVNTNDFVLVYLGYVYPYKGIETLLKAFKMVSNEKNNVRLVLVGGSIDSLFPKENFQSYPREMHELSKQLGIDHKITWTGEFRWDDEKASLYLHGADVCVLPFDIGVQLNNSSFSSVAAHGLPVITTEGLMLDQVFVHNENVFLCPPKSPEAIAAAIMGLMDQPDLRQRLRMGALKLSQEWFSWESAISRTIQALSNAS